MTGVLQSGELWTEAQVAAFLAVKPRTVRLWRMTRSLPHIRITQKVIRFRKADIDAWLERQRMVYPPVASSRRYFSRL
jgi:excisionase family DNA binding protein